VSAAPFVRVCIVLASSSSAAAGLPSQTGVKGRVFQDVVDAWKKSSRRTF
jgi:hypothetical protein